MIKFIKWKALFYINPSGKNMQETCSLKTLNCHPKIKEMVLFETDQWDLVNKLKFRKVSITFKIS